MGLVDRVEMPLRIWSMTDWALAKGSVEGGCPGTVQLMSPLLVRVHEADGVEELAGSEQLVEALGRLGWVDG